MATTVDPTVDALLESTMPATDVLDTTVYDVPADPTFDDPNALLTASVTPRSTVTPTSTKTTGPNLLLIGGTSVVVAGLGVAGYMYFTKQ